MAAVSVRYLVKRSITTVFLLWFILTFLFFFFRLMPGDYTSMMMFSGASPEAVEAFREQWGLNDPLQVQYWRYLTNILAGDAGRSLEFRRPVTEVVAPRIFNSLILIAPSITLGYLIGSVFGVMAGTNREGFMEKYGILGLFFIGAFPSFFIAIVLLIVFSGRLDLFPTAGLVSPATRRAHSGAAWYSVYFTWDFLYHYILPFSTIVLRYTFLPSLIMRTSVVEVIGQDFVRYQQVLGLPRRHRMFTVAKHASLPVITLYPISLARAIGGLVLIEVVFNWPGIGFTLVQAVFSNDFPVIQFVFLLIATFIILSNFVVDIVYGLIDPRVQVE